MEGILYKPGAALNPGDPMFRIEDTAYRASYAAAAAAATGAALQAKAADATVARYKTLQGNAVTQADLQQAQVAAATAQASVAAAKAALDVAQLDLDRTSSKAPSPELPACPRFPSVNLLPQTRPTRWPP